MVNACGIPSQSCSLNGSNRLVVVHHATLIKKIRNSKCKNRIAVPLLDTYLGNVEQNDSRKIYRLQHALRRVEERPSWEIICFAAFASLREIFRVSVAA